MGKEGYSRQKREGHSRDDGYGTSLTCQGPAEYLSLVGNSPQFVSQYPSLLDLRMDTEAPPCLVKLTPQLA